MYQSPSQVANRAPGEEEEHLTRDRERMANANNHQVPPPSYTRSPSLAGSYPTYNHNGTHAQPPPTYPGYSSRPGSSAAIQAPPVVHHSPRMGQPPSPSNGLVQSSRPTYQPREQSGSTYYDPTSEHRERDASWNPSPYGSRSPQQPRDNSSYNSEQRHQDNLSRPSHTSPTSSRFPQHSPTFPTLHAHPPSHHDSQVIPPPATTAASPRTQHQSSIAHIVNGTPEAPPTLPAVEPRPAAPSVAEMKPARADPMALSSLLSSSNAEPPASTPVSTPAAAPTKALRQSTRTSNGGSPAPAAVPEPSTNGSTRKARKSPTKELSTPTYSKEPLKPRRADKTSLAKKASAQSDAKVLVHMAEIDAEDHSDVDGPGFEKARAEHTEFNKRRLDAVEAKEEERRKRRRLRVANQMADKLSKAVAAGKESFRAVKEDEVLAEVHDQEIADEKERKKDMQRKRRREKTVLQETQKQKEAIAKARQTSDLGEREKLLKEAQKAEKKAKTTKRILDIGETAEEIGEVTPMAHNLEGGVMSTFHATNGAADEPPKKRQKGMGTRLKKSKEQKQAEKDNAEAAYLAMTMENQEPVAIAPKDEVRKDTPVKGTKEGRGKGKAVKEKEASPGPPTTNYVSKGYNQIYEQIWKDIARKDIPKVYRIKENSAQTKASNLRKTAQLASKEARRWQLKTNKSTKDTQARAKRSMREMMTFWKRNEREERDLRRVAEKQELDAAKRAEAEREANRQKRKLNFLISQTELYSHFIGKKVKTDEVERSTDSADVAKVQNTNAEHTIDLPPSVADLGTKVTNFEDLDFDAEDETALKQAAAANAQAAVKEAQDKARAFNRGGDGPDHFDDDDGEMNFQNPTSLGEVDITQPAMLNCQLKEYQLKGLNWLVNLYEQGINGILADEMGLGKTVQSISVMAYLAEKYNIWGPFLVIAPASTLHNWQQEIARFVPNMKAIPYWGTAKDRKVLRKLWDRKHITYNQESQFHVLITSYQLVVQDTQYFQKMKWQYMILDEAQAIKSSSSSRWKSLLNFHCRNRLLLTGTPIQNNMQELWALLHFIMPSLFDSHDEFSDWFSKDIESHAQSNTKLNEDQLKRLHMILKPFMLRRVKKHVQKELGDKVEKDVFCDLTYRQRAYYTNLRNRISIIDLIEKAAVGDDQDTATLMNLVMQFRKVCNHPDLFERADTTSPFAMAHFAECASFVREGHNVNVAYSTRNLIEYDLPRMLCSSEGRLDLPGPENGKAGFKGRYLDNLMNIWTPENIKQSGEENGTFSWLRFADTSASEAYEMTHSDLLSRAIKLSKNKPRLGRLGAIYDEGDDAGFTPAHAMFNIVERNDKTPLADITEEGHLKNLMNVSQATWDDSGLNNLEQCARPSACAPPIQVSSLSQVPDVEKENILFNIPARKALYSLSLKDEQAILEAKVDPAHFPVHGLLPKPISDKTRFTDIQVPSMQRFVTDSGKLAKLDQLLFELKANGHRVLLYFQMTRMIDLMEEYLTYRSYKYLRLDGSTKLEDRRDTVSDFQTKPEIFIFLLSTRAGGLGINLTSADTVIFYDSDWNPTIDSQAMDRAHRLGQTKQVTVYRMITRGTIEERIRKRALQKEEVQRVVIQGGGGAGVDFNTRSKENKTKDIALWLADDDEAELIEKKEKEILEKGDVKKKKPGVPGRKKELTMDDMYHEGEGHFNDESAKPSGAATPMDSDASGIKTKRGPRGGKGLSKKAKTAKQRLAIADGSGDVL